jgi:hypothetical protein
VQDQDTRRGDQAPRKDHFLLIATRQRAHALRKSRDPCIQPPCIVGRSAAHLAASYPA